MSKENVRGESIKVVMREKAEERTVVCKEKNNMRKGSLLGLARYRSTEKSTRRLQEREF
jgi:hypothetical protein